MGFTVTSLVSALLICLCFGTDVDLWANQANQVSSSTAKPPALTTSNAVTPPSRETPTTSNPVTIPTTNADKTTTTGDPAPTTVNTASPVTQTTDNSVIPTTGDPAPTTVNTATPVTQTTDNSAIPTTGDPVATTVNTANPVTQTTDNSAIPTTGDPVPTTVNTATPVTQTTDNSAIPTTGDPVPTTVNTATPLTQTTENPITPTTVKPITQTTINQVTLTTADLLSTTTNSETSSTAGPVIPTKTSPVTLTTATSTTTPKPLNCRNGGTYDGRKCICPVGFNGTLCESVQDISPVKVNRTISVAMVMDEPYDENYDNPSSSEYKTFVHNFTTKMGRYYKERVPDFKEVVVIEVRPDSSARRFSNPLNSLTELQVISEKVSIYREGTSSVHVEHDVVVEIPNNNTIYESDLEKVVEALNNCTNIQEYSDCPYNVSKPNVNSTEVKKDFCEDVLGNKELAEYYEPKEIDGKWTCISVCSDKHDNPETCSNNGNCTIYVGRPGPACECYDVDTTWYLGQDCDMPIQKTPFFVGLSVTLACLLILVASLTVYFITNKQRQARGRDIKKKLVDEWLNDDFEWTKPNGPNAASNFRNTTYAAEGHQNPMYYLKKPAQFNGRPTSAQTNFMPDRMFNNVPVNGGNGITNREHSGLRPSMSIGRPQIRSSFEI